MERRGKGGNKKVNTEVATHATRTTRYGDDDDGGGQGEGSPDVNHGQARLDEAADVLADLSVGLGRLAEVTPHLLVGLVQDTLLFAGRPPRGAATRTGRVQMHTDSPSVPFVTNK